MIKYTVGNEQEIFLWHDNQHPTGPLLHAYGPRIATTLGLNIDVKLSAVSDELEWHWPHARYEEFFEIQLLLCDVISPQGTDGRATWIPSISKDFRTKATWS